MLRVIVELVPGGRRELRRTIPSTGTPSRSTTCTVTGHDRHQAVWALLAKAAEAIHKAEFDGL
jgi:hypothetical protein